MPVRPRWRLAAAALAAALATAALGGSASANPVGCLRGVNLSGAEDGVLPGRPGIDYLYPVPGEIRAIADRGFNALRFPVRWERLQPRPGGDLDGAEAARLDSVLDEAASAGLTVVLDLHNYGEFDGRRLGSPTLPWSALADVWRRLATRYGGRRTVVFSLMNEPHDLPGPAWAAGATGAIAAIRAAGAQNLVLVAGTAWDGAHSWTADLPTGNNGRDMLSVRDPLDRYAFDVHQYLDADFSGRSGDCPAAGGAIAGIESVHRWLVANKRRGFLGEFAASRAPACMAALVAMAERVDADPAAWVGWTAWAAGAFWPADYPFNLQASADGDPPQLTALARAAKGAPPCPTPGPP